MRLLLLSAVATCSLCVSEAQARRHPIRDFFQARRGNTIQSGSQQSSYVADGTTSTYESSSSYVRTSGSSGTSFATLLALHNQARASHGLQPLVLDSGLMAEAQASANEQARRGRIGHWLALSGPENSAAVVTSEASTHSAWMSSSGHRSTILTPGLTRVGFGVANGPGGPYWAARFR